MKFAVRPGVLSCHDMRPNTPASSSEFTAWAGQCQNGVLWEMLAPGKSTRGCGPVVRQGGGPQLIAFLVHFATHGQ
jgi:hypothetical protein